MAKPKIQTKKKKAAARTSGAARPSRHAKVSRGTSSAGSSARQATRAAAPAPELDEEVSDTAVADSGAEPPPHEAPAEELGVTFEEDSDDEPIAEPVEDASLEEPSPRRPSPPAREPAVGPPVRARSGDEEAQRSSDPVRLYLRKMGSVPLLTREGEVAIAMRIEDGEHQVLDAILGTPIALREIIELGERLEQRKSRIREIVKDGDDEEQAFDEAEAERRCVAEAAPGDARPRGTSPVSARSS